MDLNWLISVDDHVLEPADLWQRRLPKGFREAGPRMVTRDGVEAWEWEDKRSPTGGLAAVAGKRVEEFSPSPVAYADMREGCYDSVARLADMDRAGILASLCFPSFPRFCGQVFSEMNDRELGLASLEVYNDFILEEWCGFAPGRFIPMTVIPFWDTRLAVREMARCVERGTKAIAFSENPYHLGFPSIYDSSGYWDPVFAFAQEARLPICMHTGSSSRVSSPSPDAPFMAVLTFSTSTLALETAVNWIFSGTLERFPSLKICLSEGGIGWISPLLQRAEQVWSKQRYWASKSTFDMSEDNPQGAVVENTMRTLSIEGRTPTQQFLDQVYGCFIDDRVGLRAMKDLGALGNVMIETDYPHSDSTWPNCIKYAQEQVAELSDTERYAVLRGNAERLFNFVPADMPDMAA